jgi:hypothetical protein
MRCQQWEASAIGGKPEGKGTHLIDPPMLAYYFPAPTVPDLSPPAQ